MKAVRVGYSNAGEVVVDELLSSATLVRRCGCQLSNSGDVTATNASDAREMGGEESFHSPFRFTGRRGLCILHVTGIQD
jgi:hypothetical protein